MKFFTILDATKPHALVLIRQTARTRGQNRIPPRLPPSSKKKKEAMEVDSSTPGTAAAAPLSPGDFRELFDSVDAFLFDCDGPAPPPLPRTISSRLNEFGWSGRVFPSSSSGVIWKRDRLLDGVSQTLDFLRSKVNRPVASSLRSVLVRHWNFLRIF